MSTINVNADGSLQFIRSDDLQPLLELGRPTVRRASHVEPTHDGQWTLDLSPVGGPVLGPFRLRGDAVEEELRWLRERMLWALAVVLALCGLMVLMTSLMN